jgi:molecular chaperone GrpE
MQYHHKEQRSMEDKNWDSVPVTTRLILWNPLDKKFLLVKSEDKSSFEPEHDAWGFVGGHLEKKEKLISALKREVSEEAGDIEYDILGVLDASRRQSGTLSVAYLAIHKSGNIVLSDEHTEYQWMTIDEIEKNSRIAPVLKDLIKQSAERLKEREYLNDLQRTQADFANYKKRQQESQKELSGYLIERLVMEITPVLDNFQMATGHVPEDAVNSPWVVGIQYIEKQLEKVLADNGMQIIEVKEGDIFDPNIHEAISEEKKAENADDDNTGKEIESSARQQFVVKIMQKGYKIGEKVIRPAKVVVG